MVNHEMTGKINKSSKAIQRPNLGLVCMTADESIRFRELTRTRFLRLTHGSQRSILQEIYANNLSQLNAAILFCISRKIRLYRVYSGTFPFLDTELGQEELNKLAGKLQDIGKKAKEAGIRLVSHPDQFVVLNSDRPEVIENSIRILQTHADLFDLLDQPRSAWAACNIHPGKANRAERLIKTIETLSPGIRSRLTLENDEYSYSAEATYRICMDSKIPMVFDAHHHVINQKCDSYNHASVEKMFAKARKTWHPNETWQLLHISNGHNSFHDRRHNDFITEIPDCFRDAEWVEVEAKKKDLAIEKLYEILRK